MDYRVFSFSLRQTWSVIRWLVLLLIKIDVGDRSKLLNRFNFECVYESDGNRSFILLKGNFSRNVE